MPAGAPPQPALRRTSAIKRSNVAAPDAAARAVATVEITVPTNAQEVLHKTVVRLLGGGRSVDNPSAEAMRIGSPTTVAAERTIWPAYLDVQASDLGNNSTKVKLTFSVMTHGGGLRGLDQRYAMGLAAHYVREEHGWFGAAFGGRQVGARVVE
jgi:hypothetical protein